MTARRHYARQYRRALIHEFEDHLRVSGERVARQLARLLKEKINRTLRFSSQFGTVGLRDATIDIEIDVRVGRKGLAIVLNALVLDGSGAPHLVWHVLAFGRKSFVQRKGSPPIRARMGLRTEANTLEVKRFPGYSGETFVIPAGTVVAGFEARRWYEVAAKEYSKEIHDFPSIEALNLEVVRTRIKKPNL